MSNKDPKQPKKVEVVLLEKHRHEGRDEQKGAKIWVTDRQRTFLAERKKIATGNKPVTQTK